MTDETHRGIVDGMAVAQGEIAAAIASAGMVADVADLAALSRVIVRPRRNDCGCPEGVVCRQNGNCPRRVVHKRPT